MLLFRRKGMLYFAQFFSILLHVFQNENMVFTFEIRSTITKTKRYYPISSIVDT